jgi:hypothetical protein
MQKLHQLWGMEGITSVLEGSQVFRGGQKDTTNFIPAGYGAADGARFRSAFVEGTRDINPGFMLAAKRANALAIGRGMSLEEFLATDDAKRAVGLGAMFGKRGERSNTQAVVCEKSRFADPRRAARWVRDHDFRADKRTTTDSAFVFEQFPESNVDSGSLRNITLDEGVAARVGRVRPVEEEQQGRGLDGDDRSTESFDSWLARGAAKS